MLAEIVRTFAPGSDKTLLGQAPTNAPTNAPPNAQKKKGAETVRSCNVAVQSEKTAGKALKLADQAYEQSVTAMRKGSAQNQTAVKNFEAGFQGMQTQMSALKLRQQNLVVGDQQLALAQRKTPEGNAQKNAQRKRTKKTLEENARNFRAGLSRRGRGVACQNAKRSVHGLGQRTS